MNSSNDTTNSDSTVTLDTPSESSQDRSYLASHVSPGGRGSSRSRVSYILVCYRENGGQSHLWQFPYFDTPSARSDKDFFEQLRERIQQSRLSWWWKYVPSRWLKSQFEYVQVGPPELNL